MPEKLTREDVRKIEEEIDELDTKINNIKHSTYDFHSCLKNQEICLNAFFIFSLN